MVNIRNKVVSMSFMFKVFHECSINESLLHLNHHSSMAEARFFKVLCGMFQKRIFVFIVTEPHLLYALSMVTNYKQINFV